MNRWFETYFLVKKVPWCMTFQAVTASLSALHVRQQGICLCFCLPPPSVSCPQVPRSMIGLTCGRAQLANQNNDWDTSGGCLRPSGRSLALFQMVRLLCGRTLRGVRDEAVAANFSALFHPPSSPLTWATHLSYWCWVFVILWDFDQWLEMLMSESLSQSSDASWN